MIIPEKLKKILQKDQEIDGIVTYTVSQFGHILEENKLFFFEEYTDHGVIEKCNSGMTIGATYDLSTLLKKEDSGLTFFAGLGYVTKDEVSQTYEYYVWDDFPSLNEGNLVTWISDSKTIPSFEVMLGYDFFKYGLFRLNLNVGYATTHGFIGTIGVGFAPNY